jgi:hypothetical protein
MDWMSPMDASFLHVEGPSADRQPVLWALQEPPLEPPTW